MAKNNPSKSKNYINFKYVEKRFTDNMDEDVRKSYEIIQKKIPRLNDFFLAHVGLLTGHGTAHFKNVIVNMYRILTHDGESTEFIDSLDSTDSFYYLASAWLHDCGMLENYYQGIVLSGTEVRKRHGKLAKVFLGKHEDKFEIPKKIDKGFLGNLCEAHTRACSFDTLDTNMKLFAAVLRLADALDTNSERVPDFEFLYPETIHSHISKIHFDACKLIKDVSFCKEEILINCNKKLLNGDMINCLAWKIKDITEEFDTVKSVIEKKLHYKEIKLSDETIRNRINDVSDVKVPEVCALKAFEEKHKESGEYFFAADCARRIGDIYRLKPGLSFKKGKNADFVVQQAYGRAMKYIDNHNKEYKGNDQRNLISSLSEYFKKRSEWNYSNQKLNNKFPKIKNIDLEKALRSVDVLESVGKHLGYENIFLFRFGCTPHNTDIRSIMHHLINTTKEGGDIHNGKNYKTPHKECCECTARLLLILHFLGPKEKELLISLDWGKEYENWIIKALAWLKSQIGINECSAIDGICKSYTFSAFSLWALCVYGEEKAAAELAFKLIDRLSLPKLEKIKGDSTNISGLEENEDDIEKMDSWLLFSLGQFLKKFPKIKKTTEFKNKFKQGANALYKHLIKNGINRQNAKPFGLLVWNEISNKKNSSKKFESLCDKIVKKIQTDPTWKEDGLWGRNYKVTAIKTWFLLEYLKYKNETD